VRPEQHDLLAHAKESLAAARLSREAGYQGFPASRAYYAMLYVAEAILLGKGLSFSKHAAVVAAFGEHFVKVGIVPAHFHRYLIHAMEVRHAGDYGSPGDVPPEESAEHIVRA
jgi:uncharacterized protein (UPF0332 family)